MATDGVFFTPSDAILWVIYTDLHWSAFKNSKGMPLNTVETGQQSCVDKDAVCINTVFQGICYKSFTIFGQEIEKSTFHKI